MSTVTVDVHPLPESYRTIPRFRPTPPPIFPGDDEPAEADRLLALDLWRALDVESRRWYVYGGTARHFAGLPLSAEDIREISHD